MTDAGGKVARADSATSAVFISTFLGAGKAATVRRARIKLRGKQRLRE